MVYHVALADSCVCGNYSFLSAGKREKTNRNCISVRVDFHAGSFSVIGSSHGFVKTNLVRSDLVVYNGHLFFLFGRHFCSAGWSKKRLRKKILCNSQMEMHET